MEEDSIEKTLDVTTVAEQKGTDDESSDLDEIVTTCIQASSSFIFSMDNHEQNNDIKNDDRSTSTTAALPANVVGVSNSIEDEMDNQSSLTSTSNISIYWEGVKSFYSIMLLAFVTVVVHAAIFSNQTVGTNDNEIGIHPVVVFAIVWLMTIWLATMEGGQGCLVGLQPLEKAKYAESHPITLKNTELIYKSDNMERFIIGRQFLVFLVIFVINMLGSTIDGARVLQLPQALNSIFVENGVAMILFVIIFGQLTAQVIAAKCMLDFINNKFMLYSVSYVALAIESSGLLHSVYLVQSLFQKISSSGGEVHNSFSKNERSCVNKVLYYGRVLLSCVILGFSFAIILEALFQGKTAMWNGVPPYVSAIIFFVLVSFAGMMDGMQIALFAVIKMPEEMLAPYPAAHANCQLCFKDRNLEAFLVGRQVLVTICSFVLARIISFNLLEDDINIFGVSDGIQNFFDTGILGAIVTTTAASLIWRIVASSFPLIFLSVPVINIIIQTCLFVEATGLCSASWIIADIQKRFLRYQQDAYYLNEFQVREEKENLA